MRGLPLTVVAVLSACSPREERIGTDLGTVPGDQGDGRDGPLVLPAGDVAVNNCFVIRQTLPDGSIVLDRWSEPDGRRLFLWQVQDGFATSGSSAPIAGANSGNAGRFQIARALSARADATGFIVALDPPAAVPFTSASPARRAQACTLPEYTDVAVAAAARLLAGAWDGATGGFVGFLATGTVVVDGHLGAAGGGFRGGRSLSIVDAADVTDFDTPAGRGGGKGDGLDGRAFTLAGRGNLANAGGGGNGSHSGGGGAGHRGAGGPGGHQYWVPGSGPATETPTWGLPGASIIDSSLADRITMGGGGGAGHVGHADADTPDCQRGTPDPAGGAGGGVVFVSAARFQGAGYVIADGNPGACAQHNGAGGGGAGGAIWIAAESGAFTGAFQARGAPGGDTFEASGRVGPGGGGGGGHVLVEGVGRAIPPAAVEGGLPGFHRDPTRQLPPDSWGAAAGQEGAVEIRPGR